MPYLIREDDGKFCVKPAGDSLGCHESSDQAQGQIDAIMAEEKPPMKRIDTAIKFVGNPGEGRIGGYMVVWGNASQKDLQGEYFTPETDLGLDWYDKRPVLYHHGLDGNLKAALIGTIDTLQPDEVGLWAEAQLDLRERYVRAVNNLVEKGVLGWSSGSLPHLAKTAKDGKIEKWPIVEGSLTPAPAEPRKTEISTIKSVYEQLGLDIARLNIPADKTEESKTKESPGKNRIFVKSVKDMAMNVSEFAGQIIDMVVGKMGGELSAEDRTAIMESVVSTVEGDEAAQKAMQDKDGGKLAEIMAKAAVSAIDAHNEARQKIQDGMKISATTAVDGLFANIQPKPKSKSASIPQPNTPNPSISVYTKYNDLSAEDMAYMREMARTLAGKPNFPWAGKFMGDPESLQKFDRELADKIEKSPLKTAVGPIAAKALNAIKANELDHSTQAAYGDEWVPDLWSSNLWRRVRLDNVILPLFRTVEMPSNPYELPVEGTDATLYFVPETTAETELTVSGSGNPIPDSKIGSAKVTLSAKKLALRIGFSSELEEDAIIPVVSFYRESAERTVRDGIDHVLLNGDDTNAATGNINLDDADPADTEKYLAFNGLLHSPLVEDTARRIDALGVGPTLNLLRRTRFAMPTQYAQRPGDIAWIVGGEVYQKLLGLNEFLTVDKYGPNATIMNGEIGKIDGSPVLTSAEMALAEADGKKSTTGSNNTLGRALAVFKPNWVVGYRRMITTNVVYVPYYDAYQLTSTVRIAFVHQDNDSASVLYDLAVS